MWFFTFFANHSYKQGVDIGEVYYCLLLYNVLYRFWHTHLHMWNSSLVCVCIHVCIEVALHGDAHGIGHSNWPIGIVGPISQPRGTIDTASLTLTHTCTLVCAFCSQLYSGQLRVSWDRMQEETGSHQARTSSLCGPSCIRWINFPPFLISSLSNLGSFVCS